jgi:hypothetical protein
LQAPGWINIHLYYELATVTLVGNTHGIKIIVNVPSKTASQQFTLYKIIVLPSRMSDYNFVKYVTEFSYFGLDDSHRDYILLTEAHWNRCTKSSITLCPADIAIYSAQTVTCESSLFSRILIAIGCVEGTCSLIIEPPPCSYTDGTGYIIY